jgi:hypothetical protein
VPSYLLVLLLPVVMVQGWQPEVIVSITSEVIGNAVDPADLSAGPT